MKIQVNSSSPVDLMYKYVDLLSVVLPQLYKEKLTLSERDVLARVLTMPLKYSLSRFSKIARDYLFSCVDTINNRINLNGVLYRLIDKGYLYRDEDGVIYVSKPLLKGAIIILSKVYPDEKYATDYELTKLGLPYNFYEKSAKEASKPSILLTFQSSSDEPDNSSDS